MSPYRILAIAFVSLLLSLPLQADAQNVRTRSTSEELEYQKKLGLAFMSKIADRSDVLTMSSGLQLQTIKVGSGQRPRPNDIVFVNYKGFLLDGRRFSEGTDVSFPVAELIEGFREGLLLMSEGGHAVIVIPCELGYGDEGTEVIPGGATLLFDVELIKVQHQTKGK
jgi:FKBP-type peptidyl-prolyl cis-trans isomerase